MREVQETQNDPGDLSDRTLEEVDEVEADEDIREPADSRLSAASYTVHLPHGYMYSLAQQL